MSAGLVRSLVAAAGACVLFASSPALAQQSITFAHPSAGEVGATIFRGVSGGRAAGFWHNPDTNRLGSFVYDLTSGTYTDLVFPGATYTEVTGIGGDQVVGYYAPGQGEPVKAFRYDLSRSTWTEFEHPLVNRDAGGSTVPYNISESGTIVGSFFADDLAVVRGFVREADGAFSELDHSAGGGTNVTDTDRGRFVGVATDGFFYDGSTWSPLEYPDAEVTAPWGIDGSLVVGSILQKDFQNRGFIHDLGSGAWHLYDHPGYFHTYIEDVDGDVIAGSAMRLAPGGVEWIRHGFVTTIPEPTAVTLIVGAAALAARRMRTAVGSREI